MGSFYSSFLTRSQLVHSDTVQLYRLLYSLQVIAMELALLSPCLTARRRSLLSSSVPTSRRLSSYPPTGRRINLLPSHAITQPWERDGALVPLLTTVDVGSAAPMERNSISQPIMSTLSQEAFFGRFVLPLHLFF